MKNGFTLFEIIFVLIIIIIFALASVVMMSTIAGRTIDGTSEKLAALIRSAQSRAQETETIQAIFLCKKEDIVG